MRKLLRKFRSDPSQKNVEEYLNVEKHYKTVCGERKEKAEKEYVNQVEQALESKNGKRFWQIINKETKNQYNSDNSVNPQEWDGYFAKLFNKEMDYQTLEERGKKIQFIGDLDNEITEGEVKETTKSIKPAKQEEWMGSLWTFLSA